jgi:carbonic anhydrase
MWKPHLSAFLINQPSVLPAVLSTRNPFVVRRRLLQTTLCFKASSSYGDMGSPTASTKNLVVDRPKSMNYEAVLDFLLQKNEQFQRGFQTGTILEHETLPEYRQALAQGGQKPIATIVTCCDSRVIPEAIFQQGFGKLFTVRTAGGLVASPPVLGSIQFGVETFATPLLVVMGHTECGAAITGWNVCCNEKHQIQQLSPALQSLIRPMEPLIENIQRQQPDITVAQGSTRLAEAIAKDAVVTILRELPSLKALVDKRQLGVVSAMYDLYQGKVVVLEKNWSASV